MNIFARASVLTLAATSLAVVLLPLGCSEGGNNTSPVNGPKAPPASARTVTPSTGASTAAEAADKSQREATTTPTPDKAKTTTSQAASTAEATTRTAARSTTEPSTAAPNHPATPPIDCPLRAQGMDPTHMRPFDQVADYIQFLERPDRAQWQKPDDVVAALALSGSETVVDLGAGSGYFTFRFSKSLPNGKVVAADTEPEMVRHIHHKTMVEGIDNVEAQFTDADKPKVAEGADLVFVCDVLHHVKDRAGWLRGLANQMKPGARLALIEFSEGKLPQGPPEGMKVPKAELLKLASDAGFKLTSEHSPLLPYQVFLVFKKP